MLAKIKQNYDKYPNKFWVLIGAAFIDRTGGALIFPFLAIYMVGKFGIGMTEVGVLLFINAGATFIGSFIGGAITDKFGRRKIIIFGLIASGISHVILGFVNDLNLFMVMIAVVGFLSRIGSPAQRAMIADLLPPEQHSDGYALLRVINNLAITIGPIVGGFVANQSYLLLFLIDGATSFATAVLVYFNLPETMPQVNPDSKPESLGQVFVGYRKVFQNKAFSAFLAIGIVMNLAYIQMYSTLSVYMVEYLGYEPQGYGVLLSMNAGMVVLMQLWIASKLKGFPPLKVMALGAVCYAIGIGMFGFINAFALMMLAMAIVTLGEMLMAPIGQTLTIQFSSEDMRGRYLAALTMSWLVPRAIGPLLAGLVMDNVSPQAVWHLGGLVAFIAALGYLALHKAIAHRFEAKTEAAPAGTD